MHGNDKGRGCGPVGGEGFRERDAVGSAAEAEVDDREIEASQANRRQGGAARIRLLRDPQIVLRIEQLRHPFSEKRMIIHEQNGVEPARGIFFCGYCSLHLGLQ